MQVATKRNIGLLGGLVFLALVWASIGAYRDHERQRRAAESAIALFHERFNSGDFDSICRDVFTCSEAFANSGSDMRALKDKYGAFRNVVKTKVQVSSEPRWIQVNYVSSFDKGLLREVFVVQPDSQEQPRLLIFKGETPEGDPAR